MELLRERWPRICSANEQDVKNASSLSAPLRSRLRFTEAKLDGLIAGLEQLAERLQGGGDLVGKELRRVIVTGGLELVQKSVPIGVLLFIFESRPDCLLQVNLVRPFSSFVLLSQSLPGICFSFHRWLLFPLPLPIASCLRVAARLDAQTTISISWCKRPSVCTTASRP